MSKNETVKVRLEDEFGGSKFLNSEDYPNIFLEHTITGDELHHALRTILTYMMQNKHLILIADLQLMDYHFCPPVKMTLEEIEEKLGYKVEIVSDEEKEKKDD